MVYLFGLLYFLKVLDIIQSKIKMLSNDHDNLHNKKVRTKKEQCQIFYCLLFSGIPPFDKVLFPRTGATIAAINALKDEFDAVYDVTVMYDKNRLAAPSMTGKDKIISI
jgi:hypothetical protein